MSNENSTEEFKILYNDFDKEAEAQKQWNELRKLNKDEYSDAKFHEYNDDYNPICPYCKNEVGFTEDIYPPGDAVGYKNQSKYVTELFRKCEHCNKVFIEELGEETDYFY